MLNNNLNDGGMGEVAVSGRAGELESVCLNGCWVSGQAQWVQLTARATDSETERWVALVVMPELAWITVRLCYAHCLGCLSDWLTACLTDWLTTNWLIDWATDRQTRPSFTQKWLIVIVLLWCDCLTHLIGFVVCDDRWLVGTAAKASRNSALVDKSTRFVSQLHICIDRLHLLYSSSFIVVCLHSRILNLNFGCGSAQSVVLLKM